VTMTWLAVSVRPDSEEAGGKVAAAEVEARAAARRASSRPAARSGRVEVDMKGGTRAWHVMK